MIRFSHILLAVIVFLSHEMAAQRHQCQSGKNRIPLRGGSIVGDPGNLRSDTLDVLSYDINLDMTLMNSSQIKANCAVTLQSLMDNINHVNLDLRSLGVDSVKWNNELLLFTHVGEQLQIVLPSVVNTGDIVELQVFYHGTPGVDDSWGGFYFQSGYAYNIGVAFTSEPHTFGRVWFPCFDNFVERSSFTFHVLTNQNRKAYCNGMRTGIDTVGQDSIITHWHLEEQIPSYLASISVTNYTQVNQSFQSMSGDNIPLLLVARAADTTEMKQSMIHIPAWMEAAETKYGPYRWPRLGYCAVPFNAGAMEHATNISYPLFGIDGTLGMETTAAHEAAHHWWGDLVTCRNAADMWINEGWASYSEALFMELIYDYASYIDYVRDNHKESLLYAHIRDNGRYPVSGIPSENTYGDHVYNKGADVAHTLRGYMGDDDFFEAIKDFLDVNQFSDVSSEDLRDHLQNFTEADLSSFFDNWVFAAGYPEFRVREFSSGNNNQWNVVVDQHQHYTSDYYTNVPMQLVAVDDVGNRVSMNVLLSNESTDITMSVPDGFIPVTFFLNENDAISQAVLGETQILTQTGSSDFDFAEFDLDVMSMGSADSIFMRVENHWAAASENQSQPEFFISPDRWWNVYHNGTEEAVDLKATIRYYGNDSQSNYYDPLFFDYFEANALNEDSILLVYRPDELSEWQEWSDYTRFTIPGLTNWNGRIEIHHVSPGQYAWAARTGVNGITNESQLKFSVYQNGNVAVCKGMNRNESIHVTDLSGKRVYAGPASRNQIECTAWAKGVYVFQLVDSSGEISGKQRIMIH